MPSRTIDDRRGLNAASQVLIAVGNCLPLSGAHRIKLPALLKSALAALGWFPTLLLIVHRMLDKLSAGRVTLVPFALLAQPLSADRRRFSASGGRRNTGPSSP